MHTTPQTDTLAVPGASLHYEIRGSGPLLLLICGGVYDAGGYAELAEQLADRWTVVAYDRRGNSRSALAGEPSPQEIAQHADDAHRLLSALGADPDAPACVFGNSSGAIIAVELAARHPEQLRTVVAHEPPLFELLDDRERWRAMLAEIDAALASGGPYAALEILGARLAEGADGAGASDAGASGGGASARAANANSANAGANGANAGANGANAGANGASAGGDGAVRRHTADDVPRDAAADAGEAAEMTTRIAANMEFFIRFEVPSFARHALDLDAVAAGGARVLGAAGSTSGGEPPHRAGLALAAALGTDPLLLPGGHGGFGGATVAAFADQLDRALRA